MEERIKRAKERLEEGYTCVILRDEETLTSRERGVKPLVVLLEQGEECFGAVAADRVVGRATAFLYVLLGVKGLFAGVVSEPALRVLKEAGIRVTYGTCVEHIINRRGDGICPFEEAVMNILDPAEAYGAIRETMRELKIEV